MKAVMLSIKPKWCELIASGKKTMEVRKTHPRLETPFKCYIYCTKGGGLLTSVNGVVQKVNEFVLDLNNDCHIEELNGKVIGEFVCDDIEPIHEDFMHNYLQETNLSYVEMDTYLGEKQFAYGWHISDLVIYDEPKELIEFCKPCERQAGCDCRYCKRHNGNKPILRPPQSWCYVEDIT